MSTSSITPKKRPEMNLNVARQVSYRQIFADLPYDHATALIAACPVIVLAIRGYYPDSFGRPHVNDYGVFDDAAFVTLPDGSGLSFNWNTDPSAVGWNPGVDKFYAMLTERTYVFRQGAHHPGQPNEVTKAFRQLTPSEARDHHLSTFFPDERAFGHFPVRRVERDKGVPEGKIEWGLQNINIHPGGKNGTSSWGCQTCATPQWNEFQQFTYDEMRLHGQGPLLAYVLASAGAVP